MDIDKEVFELLPKTMVDAYDGLKELHNCPDEMAVPLVLGMANYASHALYNVDGRLWDAGPISLYMTVLAGSAELKSTNLNEVSKGAKQYEAEQIERYKIDRIPYEKEFAQYKADVAAEYKKDPTMRGTMPQPPVEIIGDSFIQQKGTTNGLVAALRNTPHTGFINPDAVDLFKGYSFLCKCLIFRNRLL